MKLSANQKKEVKSLIRLGDSPRLAVKTVRAAKIRGSEIYQQAYYS